MNRHISFLVLSLLCFCGFAQQDLILSTSLDKEDSAYLEFRKEFAHIFSLDNEENSFESYDSTFNEEEIKNRLYNLNEATPFELVYNKKVDAFIKVYLQRKREHTANILGLSKQYYPMFEEMLDAYDLPLELKHLAVVESALNPVARSRARATGLWQFMYSTGRLYGLNITSYEDERKNPIKATDAACRYLRDLYKMFGNWELALAAYNSGPGNVRKAIRYSGGKKNYWEIYPYLPRETRGYVPAFIAVNYAYNYYGLHGIIPKDTAVSYFATDTIKLPKNSNLAKIAKWAETDVETLRLLNPSLKSDVVPAKDYQLRLPAESALLLSANIDSLYSTQKTEVESIVKEPSEPAYVYYRVRKGDYLGRIARRYGTSVSNIKRWNGLRSNNLAIGQRLKIVNKNATKTSKPEQNVAKVEKPKTNNPAPVKTAEKAPAKNYKYYTIQPGDTLWDIAARHKGLTVSKLKQLNTVYNVRRLKPGQKIIIGVEKG